MLQKKMTIKSNLLNILINILSVLLMISFIIVFCNAIQVTLQQRSDHLDNLSHRLFNRIDNLRFITSQVFNDLTEVATNNSNFVEGINPHDEIDYVNKPAGKTEAVIFGSHDRASIKTAQRIANYFDTLWGGMRETWTMYYLNGQDNSLTLISTLPLKALLSQKNNLTLNRLISSRRAEMLQQANMLDERESVSTLRHPSSLNNNWFFTMRTTYNQPGRLATVLAFDVPIKDLVSKSIDITNLQFKIDENADTLAQNEKLTSSSWQFNPSSLAFEITAPIPGNALLLTYPLPLGILLKKALSIAYLPLVLLLLISLGLLYARVLIRQLNYIDRLKQRESQPHVFRNMSREIIQTLPHGFAIYDLRQEQVVLMNDRAEKILLDLNLKNLITLADDDEEELLQVSVDNQNYVIRQRRSGLVPTYRLLMISEPDKEQMISTRLQNAQRLMEANQMLRKQLFKQLAHYLEMPLTAIQNQLIQLAPVPLDQNWQQLLSSQRQYAQLVHNIVLLNAIEENALPFSKHPFLLQTIIDQQITHLQKQLNNRNIQLLVHHAYPANYQYIGEAELLANLLMLLLNYSFNSVEWGKVTLHISIDAIQPDVLSIVIVDTSTGLSAKELRSIEFPFNQDSSQSSRDRAKDLDLFLAGKIAEYFHGSLKIDAIKGIGTRYALSLCLETAAENPSPQILLEDMVVFLDIVTEEIRTIAMRHLENLGADCVISDSDYNIKCYDFMVTDDPEKLQDWGLLLIGDELPPRLPSTQMAANYNIFQSVKDAVTKLIEQKITTENMEDTVEEQNNAIWMQSEYFQIFESTVPDDINKLYSEITRQDYTSLALTAHRLKGVFAMLNLQHGRILCEQLEYETLQINDVNIKKMTSELDQYVRTLLQQGRN